jgi:hypothetical protein
MEPSQSISATQGVELSFSRYDLAVAKIAVRELIARGAWPMPGGTVDLPDHVLDELWEQEAVKYLQLQKARRQGDAKGNEGPQLCSETEALGQLGESLRGLPSEHASEL